MSTSLILPNCEPLLLKLPEDSAAWRTWVKPERLSVSLPKRSCPVVMNNPVSNYQVVFADFDGCMNEAELIAELDKSALPYLSLSSVSGKFKAAYVVRFKGLPTRQDKIEFLKDVLPESLHNKFDVMGIDRCFVNAKTIKQFQEELEAAPVCTWKSASAVNPTAKSFRYFSDTLLDSRLEKYLVSFKDKALARDVLKILQTTFHLAAEGFGLSTRVISAQLGVHHTYVSATLKKLVEINLLDCVDSSYKWGKKARHYKAKWVLKTIILEKKAAHATKLKGTAALPTVLTRGTTYGTFLKALWSFETAEEFMKWAENLPGIQQRGRYGMAKSMSRSHFRKLA